MIFPDCYTEDFNADVYWKPFGQTFGIRNKVFFTLIVHFDNVYSIHNRVDDAKSTLQEMLQKDGLTWEYKMIDSFGLDHDKTFVVALYIDGSLVSQAEGKSIHLAQNECARIYLHDMNKL